MRKPQWPYADVPPAVRCSKFTALMMLWVFGAGGLLAGFDLAVMFYDLGWLK